MKVTVEITGVLRRPTGEPRIIVEVAPGATARDVIAKLGYNEVEQRALRLSRRAKALPITGTIDDGDELAVFAAIGGG